MHDHTHHEAVFTTTILQFILQLTVTENNCLSFIKLSRSSAEGISTFSTQAYLLGIRCSLFFPQK